LSSSKLRYTLTLCVLIAAAIVVLAPPAAAKPFPCDQVCYPQPEAGNAWCTCPTGTALDGQVIRCLGYFQGFCGLGAAIITPQASVCSSTEQAPVQAAPAAPKPALPEHKS